MAYMKTYFGHYLQSVLFVTVVAAAALMAMPEPALSADMQQAIKLQQAAQSDAAKSQKKIDKLADAQQELWQKYTAAQRQLANLKIYNENLGKLTASQAQEIQSLQQQILQVEVTAQGIVPLMIKMVDTLEKFVELDIPFLPEERRQRISSLKDMLERADVTAAEKYRRVMEAYEIETQYGRTIEAYTGKLAGDDSRTVDFLRVGRIALLYVTLDGAEAGHWDGKGKSWQVLEGKDVAAIAKGLQIARKQAAPELLQLPVAKWEAAP